MTEHQEPADPETASSGRVGRSIDEFVHQLRGFTDRARSLAGAVPSKLSLPSLPSPPGAMSASMLCSSNAIRKPDELTASNGSLWGSEEASNPLLSS